MNTLLYFSHLAVSFVLFVHLHVYPIGTRRKDLWTIWFYIVVRGIMKTFFHWIIKIWFHCSEREKRITACPYVQLALLYIMRAYVFLLVRYSFFSSSLYFMHITCTGYTLTDIENFFVCRWASALADRRRDNEKIK